ncbi:MAG: hypothetical protein LBS74_03020 [Oscillospiraceae bacterium]|jgi:hypothetical protein|nr:hypothetical protein [Oscillospiraceae bacterium]
MKHIVCFSGGHSSALVAVETARKYGSENTILLNHDISSKVEHEDIKRFKDEVAEYLKIKITYANHPDFENIAPIDVALSLGGFQFKAGIAQCTSKLKTEPFYKYLSVNWSGNKRGCDILYGFDGDEPQRISRKQDVMRSMGYSTQFPLADWTPTISNIEEIGIQRPCTYSIFKHANCIGCLKAGMQHWYGVYCTRPDIFEYGEYAEKKIGYSIIKKDNGERAFLKDLEPKYHEMKYAQHICPNEHTSPNTFWAMVEKVLPEQCSLYPPCDCSF